MAFNSVLKEKMNDGKIGIFKFRFEKSHSGSVDECNADFATFKKNLKLCHGEKNVKGSIERIGGYSSGISESWIEVTIRIHDISEKLDKIGSLNVWCDNGWDIK